jgi:hypothetical protein
MNISNRWLLLFATLAAGAAIASTARYRHHRTAHVREHKSEVKSWENEGGNLAPVPEAAVLP